MRTTAVLSLAFLGLSTTVDAHPHHYVDQQVALVIEQDHVSATLTIVPSDIEGPAIFKHLDGDGNGEISPDEAARFAKQVAGDLRIMVNGTEQVLTLQSWQMPEPDAIKSGSGAITVDLHGPDLSEPYETVTAKIGFSAFSTEWALQPWLGSTLPTDMPIPEITRGENSLNLVFAP